MRRPRWHDVLIVVAIMGLLGVGVWALWWDDVRGAMGWGTGSADEPVAQAATPNT